MWSASPCSVSPQGGPPKDDASGRSRGGVVILTSGLSPSSPFVDDRRKPAGAGGFARAVMRSGSGSPWRSLRRWRNAPCCRTYVGPDGNGAPVSCLPASSSPGEAGQGSSPLWLAARLAGDQPRPSRLHTPLSALKRCWRLTTCPQIESVAAAIRAARPTSEDRLYVVLKSECALIPSPAFARATQYFLPSQSLCPFADVGPARLGEAIRHDGLASSSSAIPGEGVGTANRRARVEK